jgi:hypothetical protein
MNDMMAMTGWALFFVTYIAGWVGMLSAITEHQGREMDSLEKSILFAVWLAVLPIVIFEVIFERGEGK